MDIVGLILSVCLLFSAKEVAESTVTESLGELTFQCETGWYIHGGNCFKPIDVPMPYSHAVTTCYREGAFLYYAQNEIEYFDYVSRLLQKKIWFGLARNWISQWEMGGSQLQLSEIPGWANFQPDESQGNFTAVSMAGVEIVQDTTRLPFVCKRRACLQGYMSCDLSTKCISEDRKCDGVPDCLDGSDENSCSANCRYYNKLTLSSGTIQTGVFNDNKNCMWILEAPVGKRIRLLMPQSTLEQNSAFIQILSGAPTVDTEIFVGTYRISLKSRIIATFTGPVPAAYIYSDNNFMIIRAYTTDVTTSSSSVTLSWLTDIPLLPAFGSVTAKTAGSSFDSLTVPFSMEKYGPPELELTWLILAPDGELITFYLQIDPHTGYTTEDVDYKILMGDRSTEIQYRNYYTTPGNQLHVTSTFVPKNGNVKLFYRTGCGMDIPASYGIIHSPEPVPNNLMCNWTLTGGQSVSRGMALKFLKLDLEQDPRTINPNTEIESKDILEIFIDGSATAYAPELMEYNNDVDNIIHAPGGRFRIGFTSDEALQSVGFQIGFGTDCETLNLSNDTELSTNMSYFMEEVNLTCPEGYNFHMERYSGDDYLTLTCDDDVWKIEEMDPGAIPECRIVYCGTPDPIENGLIKAATGATYGSVATYQCNPGFQMNGGENATCNDMGMWDVVPTCTSSQCKALAVSLVADGSWEIIAGNNFTAGNADFNTVVQFSCNEGYELIGPNLTHCEATGWTHELQNKTAKCQKLPCPIPAIRNSDIPLRIDLPAVLYKDTFSVLCNAGYRFDSGDAGTVTLTCQANQTFDKMLECIDIDECNKTSDSCDRSSTECVNTDGAYVCECKTGFLRMDNHTCKDINECSEDNGGCNHICSNINGSYHCECETGFELYREDGFHGFDLPPSENGERPGDMYYINHTCVAIRCPALTPVNDGIYLNLHNSLDGFHYNDTVDLQCMDGYVIQGSQSKTRTTLRCGDGGTWNQLYNCTARKCSIPAEPTYGKFDKTELYFGEVLTLTCNLTETTDVTRTARCIYENDTVRLGGENMTTCPEIDCGDPDIVMPSSGMYDGNGPTTTTYFPSTSTFTFKCEPGFDTVGFSGDSVTNTTVRCKANGRWSFGTLACTGKMCTDPGTPGDAEQHADGYEVGSVLYYTCNRGGFEITSPANYTCEYISATDTAAWSDDLSTTLPECVDMMSPEFAGSCNESYDLDAMDSVNFNPGNPSDNFGVATLSQDSYIKSGDIITASTSVTYTAEDFQGNEATCHIAFSVIDRNMKPSLTCPDYVMLLIAESATTARYEVNGNQQTSLLNMSSYNTSSHIVSDGQLSVTPSPIVFSKSDIGTAQIVTATAADEYGTESTCTFMVNYEANDCFEEELFSDNSAIRTCDKYGSDLVCTSTCKSGYLYKDGADMKNFTCTGAGAWNLATDPNDRYCLSTMNVEYEVPVSVIYTLTYFSKSCLTQFTAAVNRDLPDFKTRLSALCSGINWNVTVTKLDVTTQFSEFRADFKLTLLTTSATIADRDACVAKIPNNQQTFDVDNRQLTCGTTTYSLTASFPTKGTPVQTCTQHTYIKITSGVENGEICVSVGPGEFYDSVSASVMSCLNGKYQDELAQTSCKECPSGKYPNADKTGCQTTCPAGFTSTDGFYPCKPCPVDQYWVNKTTCLACPLDSSTVGQEGVASQNMCYAKCPAGSYSRTGYNVDGCTSCPMNFYQDTAGQMTCKECKVNQIMQQTGSTHSDNCTGIPDTCDGAYCNNKGSCEFAYHRRVCQCNPGYYGDTCEKEYHICDGNPCTNGATCNRGTGSTNYTCSCRTDLDVCEMFVANETFTGSNAADSFALNAATAVNNLEQCKTMCLNNGRCKDASFITLGDTLFCVMYSVELAPNLLAAEKIPSDEHIRKNCSLAFGGNKCEKDIDDNCVDAGCHPNSQCVDMINGFKCICPSAGGYTGTFCNVTSEPCSPDPCDHGTCNSYGSVRYECTCDPGYEGIHCDREIDTCAPHPDPCLYGGSCTSMVGYYRCDCINGFSGSRCEQSPNYCASHICGGNNICYNSIDQGEGVCVCDETLFTPMYRCIFTEVANESASAVFENYLDYSDWSLEECRDICQNRADCAVFTYTSKFGGQCFLYNSSYNGTSSAASTAYYKDCTNSPAEAYACARTANPCDTVNCNNGTCRNASDTLTAICSCQEGFTGSRCQHSIDNCAGVVCRHGGTCRDLHMGYECMCASGYTGELCETNIDDCPGNCITTNGVCQDMVDDYFCSCSSGFVGGDCEFELNECASHPCKHGANCTDLVNDYSCDCPPGWKGKQCDQRVNNCKEGQCLNGGQCFSLEETSFCRCLGGALGDNCENATLVCDVLQNIELCTNGGTCINEGGTAECMCAEDINAERCYFGQPLVDQGGGQSFNESDIVSADSIKTCEAACLLRPYCNTVSLTRFGCVFYKAEDVDMVNSNGSVTLHRTCPIDYNGRSCEMVRDWCDEDVCENGGECVPIGPVGYQCNCLPGYSGVNCHEAEDPCSSNPCGSSAVCRSTVTEYMCQCPQGKEWTGSSCRESSPDYTLVVNSYQGQTTPSLQTPFRLDTNEISVLMRVRVHHVNRDLPNVNLLTIIASADFNPQIDFNNISNAGSLDFRLTCSPDAGCEIFSKGSRLGSQSFDDYDIHDGAWHHLGLAISSSGLVTVEVDPFETDPVQLSQNLSLAANAQIYLGYGYLAEFENLTVWNRALSGDDMVQAYVNEFKPAFSPVQGWWNYRLPASSMRRTQRLDMTLKVPTEVEAPNLLCEEAEDIDYTTMERLTQLTDIMEYDDMLANMTSELPATATVLESVPNDLTWGYYPAIIVAKNESTKNYRECRFSLYIRYNEKCPEVVTDDTVSLTSCPEPDQGYCSIMCTSPNRTVVSAPTPSYIICGSLGVYDHRTPYENFIMPSCTETVDPGYIYTVGMQYEFSIACSSANTGTGSQKLIAGIRDTFKTGLKNKWQDFCSDTECTNLKIDNPVCVTAAMCTGSTAQCDKRVYLSFTISLESQDAVPVDGGSMPVEDALKIIVLIEKDIQGHIDNVAGASLVPDSVEITMTAKCGAGQMMIDGQNQCVNCSKGWFYDEAQMKCSPCDYGFYQDMEGQSMCKPCQTGNTTYTRGARSLSDCKVTCPAGRYFDEVAAACVNCERHYYQNKTGKNFCYPCAIKFKTAANGSDSETDCKEDCDAGFYRTVDTGECMQCEQGFWRSLTYDDCQPCPENKTTYLNKPADSADDCLIDICALGEYFNETTKTCTPCDIGYYQDELYKLNCTKCPGNSTTRITGVASMEDCEFYCPAGYEQRNMSVNECSMCERGFYKDNVGNSRFGNCSSCPTVRTTDARGATMQNNCSIPVCSQGFYIDIDSCELCPLNTYSDVELPTSATQCVSCDRGDGRLYGTENEGSANSSDCRRYCESGTYLSSSGFCVSCDRGTYKDNNDDRFSNCSKCPSDMTTDSSGATSLINCSTPICSAGYETEGDDCNPCDFDYYQPVNTPNSTQRCLACSIRNGLSTGTNYTESTSETDCLAYCPAGRFFSGMLTSSSQCQPCPRGQYRNNVGQDRFLYSCKDCPSGTTTEMVGSTNITNCSIPACKAGQYLVGGVCTNCSVNYYSEVSEPNSTVTCTSCPTKNGVSYGTEYSGADNVTLCKPICPAGEQYSISTSSCEKCNIGYFKVQGDRFGMCQSCETVNPGNVTEGLGATSGDNCTVPDCAKGNKIVGVGCEVCPVGTYQNETRKNSCYDCGENLSTDGPGKTSSAECQVECGPGLQGNESCSLCPAGMFKNVTGYKPCEKCPPNYTSNDERTLCNILLCSPGYEYITENSVEACKKCAAGYYKNTTGNTSCNQCPAGFTTNGTGQTTCDEPYCIAGKYLAGSTCQNCPVGTYKGTVGNQNCTKCGAGLTTENTGSTALTQCDTVVCPAGKYREPTQKTLCTNCPSGKYQPDSGQTKCLNCSTGEITLDVGQTSVDACVPECQKGQQYNATSEECDPCPRRTYKDTIGNTMQCTDCPENKTTVLPGATSASDCSQDVCPPGTYFTVESQAIKCVTCPVGSYNDEEMQESCKSCGGGNTTFETGSTSHDVCIEKCAAGYGYRTYEQDCHQCPTGQYNSGQGANPNTCKLCPPGKTNTQSGSTSCLFPETQQRVERRVNVSVTVMYQIAIDACDDRAGINIIVSRILEILRTAFLELKTRRYNTDKTFCLDSCSNLNLKNPNSLPRCQMISQRKRAISHEIELDIVFRNVSYYVMDQSDNNSFISTVEVISRLLQFKHTQLTDQALEVIYFDYTNITTTQLCNTGEYLTTSGTCMACPVGQYGSDMVTCQICPVDTYQNQTGQGACKSCPVNMYTNGTTGSTKCISICQAGYQFNFTSAMCDPCPVGYYKTSAGNTMNCTACVDGYTTVGTGATSSSGCSQRLCVAGENYTQSGDVISCNPCPLGTYSITKMASSCLSCPSGQTTVLTGSNSDTDCVVYCAAGQGWNSVSEQCDLCPVGYYNNRTGGNPNLCKACPDGKTNTETGQITCPLTVTAPQETERVDIRISVTYSVTISCTTTAITTVRLRIQEHVRGILNTKRQNRFSSLNSFCKSGCLNVFVQLRTEPPCLSGNRKKRQEGADELSLDITLQNVTKTSDDTISSEKLVTEEVVSQIIKYNKDEFSTSDFTLTNSSVPKTSEVCQPGQQASSTGTVCVACAKGTYSVEGLTCKPCGQDQYQDLTGQSTCKDCPDLTFFNSTGAVAVGDCKSYCDANPSYCNYRGDCRETGRESADCLCYDDYLGTYCEGKKDPADSSNLPIILGAAIGGGGGLLVLILIVVGVYRYLSDKEKTSKKPLQGDYQNAMYEDDFYDNYGYQGGQPYPLAPYRSIGYPALGYRPDTSFEEGSYARPYRTRPNVRGEEPEESQFVWTA